MKYEVELKYRVDNHSELELLLRDLDAEFGSAVRQIDRYFSHPSRDFATTDEALRIRRNGSTTCVTYKGPKLDTKTKTRREIELPLVAEDGYLDDFSELLAALGFGRVAEVEKSRTPGTVAWQSEQIGICLDVVERVGSFIELELISTADELERCQQLVTSLAAKLQLTEIERRSYLEMVLELPEAQGAS